MTERIGVEITAKDGASKVFQEVSKSADKMGADIEKAGSRSSKAMAALQANAKQIGASLGIVASGLALAGRSAYNHQRELDALNRMYGESAQQLVSFSKEMENLTNVTDDQALVMSNTMGTLVQNYGMSVEQIETLIQRIQNYGCVIKSVESGLLDFLCERDGRDVYLCWRYGEPSIRYFHEVHSGFQGRRPI